MRPIHQFLAEHPFFGDLDPSDLEYLAECARNEVFRPDETIFREGERADRFYVIRHGDVALMINAGPRGLLTVQTLHDGDVFGWSWLIPPYRWHFEARSGGTTRITSFDGACLRDKCESTPRLGYELMKRFSAEMIRRFEQTYLQLIDVYGRQADGVG